MNSFVAPSLCEVAPGVYAWIGAHGASNAGVIDTPHGLTVIDATEAISQGIAFRHHIETTLRKPIRRLINTHFHLDHIAGNAAFADVAIVAHERTRKLLQNMLGASDNCTWRISDTALKLKLFFGANFEELVSPESEGFSWFVERASRPDYDVMPVQGPDLVFADRLEIALPSDILRCSYDGPAHCDGDLTIYLPRAGVVFLGDLLFVERLPWFGDCNLDGWICSLDRIMTLDVKVVIPGHGPPATLREVAAFRDMLVAIRGVVAQAVKHGLSEDAAVAEIELPQYARLQRYSTWMPSNIRSTYRFIKGH